MTTLAPTRESYFTDRLLCQQRISPNTVASYRDAFRLLLAFVQRKPAPRRRGLTSPNSTRPRSARSSSISSMSDTTPLARGTFASRRSTRSFSTARCATPSTPR
jgi:hypothetical protein